MLLVQHSNFGQKQLLVFKVKHLLVVNLVLLLQLKMQYTGLLSQELLQIPQLPPYILILTYYQYLLLAQNQLYPLTKMLVVLLVVHPFLLPFQLLQDLGLMSQLTLLWLLTTNLLLMLLIHLMV